jgi:hypothetical protein
MEANGRPESQENGPAGSYGRLNRWLLCLLGFFTIWVFMFVVGPFLAKSSWIKPLADFIEESGIDAGAIYYTEVEEVGEAEMNMRGTFKYTPRGEGSSDNP